MTFGQCPASAEAAKRAIGAFPIAAKAPNWLQNVYFLASHQDRQRRSDRALHQVVLLGTMATEPDGGLSQSRI